MDKKTAVSWEGFAPWEVNLARGKAKGLVGKYGFTETDLPDISQELLLEIHLKRNAGNKWKKHTATPRTILSRILDNRICKIIEAASAQKRGCATTDSLETTAGHNDDGDVITLGDLLGDDRVVLHRRNPATKHPQDLCIDLSLKAYKLSSLQLRINTLIMEGWSITEVAAILGLPRTTLNHELMRIRKIFRWEELDAYL